MTNYTDGNFVATVAAGGAVSVFGGGKFANGAMSAAYGYILNYCSKGACDTALEQAMYDYWPGYKAGTGLLNSYRNGTFDFTAWEVVDGISVGVGAAGRGLEFLGEGASAVQTFRGGTLTLPGGEHALLRIGERNITAEMISMTVDKGLPFAYLRDDAYRVGFYNSELKLFVGTIEGRITTVFKSNANYIKNIGGYP
jgi:hypothetical protein